MNNFIKQNWFRLGILVVIVFISITYFFNSNNEFERNMECYAHKKDVTEELEARNSAYLDYDIIKIFYSPKENECLVTFREFIHGEGSKTMRLTLQKIQDIDGDSIIKDDIIVNDKIDWNLGDAFEKKVSKYE